ncbi:aminoglycoside phosphotransferase family protein [Rossellomorea aquimaris]|uniref:aminoglycoside phosphotransferase family protein n=1 Tax=Rossellomorea aquimaris TaxID=189382 RepID=UPI001CD2CF45|nr:aminoglycoside phosphotransferase family protein [Rossellomorea aquimaris]MCA1058238.1 aminoglycoside phosphotransferase family protein [Rossellomorea aquimaris]
MIPTDFRLKMQTIYGDSGKDWMAYVEGLLESLKDRLQLTYDKPFSLSYNFVVPVRIRQERDAVLKIGYPNNDFSNEFHALQDFQGRGMVEVLDYNKVEGWILLDRLLPGASLHSIDDEEEVLSIFAHTAKRLWHKPVSVHSYPTVQSWSKGIGRLRERFNGGSGPIPEDLVLKAENLYTELLGTSTDRFLLHGDLHHGNILYSDSSGWTAIDPKGLIGEREYDCIQFMLNEWKKWEVPIELLRYRTRTLASLLSLSYERLISYGFCHSILSASWSVEDGLDGWKNGVSLARMFEDLLEE